MEYLFEKLDECLEKHEVDVKIDMLDWARENIDKGEIYEENGIIKVKAKDYKLIRAIIKNEVIFLSFLKDMIEVQKMVKGEI